LAAGQRESIDITGAATGYAVINNTQLTTQVSVIHEYRNSSGQVLTSLVTPATSKLTASARTVILDEAKRATGVNIINPSDETATVTYTLRRQNGTVLGTATSAYEADRQAGENFFKFSEFKDSLAGTIDATMEIAATESLAITSLSHRANSMTHLREHPVQQDHASYLTFTDAPVTPETKSFLELVTDNNAATYTVKFFNPDGSARAIKTDEKGTGSVFAIDVSANSLQFLNLSQFADNGEAQNNQEHVTVEKNVPSARAHLYATRNGQELHIRPAIFNTTQRIRVEKDANSEINLSLLNAESFATEVKLYLLNEDGTTAAEPSLILGKQQTMNLQEVPGLETLADGFTGTLHLLSTEDICATATAKMTSRLLMRHLSDPQRPLKPSRTLNRARERIDHVDAGLGIELHQRFIGGAHNDSPPSLAKKTLGRNEYLV
jgi:hypothetical protein